MRRLPDQVEREVGEAEVDLEHRPMAAPFAEPLAEDQRVVAEPQQIIEMRRRPRSPAAGASKAPAPVAPVGTSIGGKRRHQMCFTSSGMS